MTFPSADAAHLAMIRGSSLLILREVLEGPSRDVVFLDAPTYRNFGDSMIWEGSVRYLRRLGYRIRYSADVRRFREEDLRRVSAKATIILQGGGNLGDLWPLHEEFRHHIVNTYPRRRILVMPQSIHFDSPAELRRSGDAYAHAENLTLLLRDSRSMAIAGAHFRSVDHRFCHDAAFGVRVPARPPQAAASTLVVARNDKEARAEDRAFLAEHAAVDWQSSAANEWLYGKAVWLKNYYRYSPRLVQHALPSPTFPYDILRRLNVGAAIRQLSGAKSIVTNRLHVHVLSALLGIPHVVTDNTYGKISGIFHDYSGQFSTAHWADSLTEAHAMAQQLPSQSTS